MHRRLAPEPLVDAVGVAAVTAVLAEKEPLPEGHGVVFELLRRHLQECGATADTRILPPAAALAAAGASSVAPSTSTSTPAVHGSQQSIRSYPLLSHNSVQL